MSELTKLTFTSGEVSLDISVSKIDKTAWLSRKDISLLFNKSFATISRHIKILFDENCKKVGYLFSKNEKKSNDVFGRPTVLFNLEIILLLSEKYGSSIGEELKAFVDDYLSDNTIDSNEHITNNIIIYNNGNISIDVNVSPEEETVWLNQRQIAELFGISQQNVSVHIRNILDEGELDNSVYKENLYTDSVHKENLYTDSVGKKSLHTEIYQKEIRHIASDGKEYSVTFYNLDMILAIGYRVKSGRAIQFRRWASEVLKKYMMTGYVVDKERSVVTLDNFNGLVNKVNSLSDEMENIKETMYIKPLKERLFFSGDFFDAYEFICDLMSSAKRRLIIIDPYFDYTCFKYLKKVNKNVEVVVVLSMKKGNVTNNDLVTFKKQYFPIRLVYTEDFHNRFLIIDDSTCYDIGTSLNHMGRGIFAIHLMEQDKITRILIDSAK